MTVEDAEAGIGVLAKYAAQRGLTLDPVLAIIRLASQDAEAVLRGMLKGPAITADTLPAFTKQQGALEALDRLFLRFAGLIAPEAPRPKLPPSPV